MEWIVRFFLGLPARPAHIEEIKKALPELLSGGSLPSPTLFHRWFLLGVTSNADLLSSDDVVSAIRKWLSGAAKEQSIVFAPSVTCPSPACPLRSKETNRRIQNDYGDDSFPIELMAVGGDAKGPLNLFLELMRNVHKKQHSIAKRIYLTDKFIYSDKSEDGTPGGFDNLVSYLETLDLELNSTFTLFLTPSPKRSSITAQTNLHKLLRAKFRNIEISQHTAKHTFHDRLYVVRYESDSVTGMFGPSLNGLSAKSIVLMGEIEQGRAMDKVIEWFC